MARKNRYFVGAHVATRDFLRLLSLFCEDLSASQTARLTGISRQTVNRYYRILRERMAAHCEVGERLEGVLKADESYFGAKRIGGRKRASITAPLRACNTALPCKSSAYDNIPPLLHFGVESAPRRFF